MLFFAFLDGRTTVMFCDSIFLPLIIVIMK
jgi:hypothetical protein